MVWIARVLDKLDSVLSWWTRLAANPWVTMWVTIVTAYLFSAWTWFSAESAGIIVTTVLGATTFVVLLFTFLPALLRKLTYPPFAVLISSVFATRGSPRNSIMVHAYIINQSPKKRVVLNFTIHFRSADGKERWSQQPELHNINPGLDPRHHTEGIIAFHVGPVDNLIPTEPNSDERSVKSDRGIYLHVIDYISRRSARFRIPGAYPPGYFIP